MCNNLFDLYFVRINIEWAFKYDNEGIVGGLKSKGKQ